MYMAQMGRFMRLLDFDQIKSWLYGHKISLILFSFGIRAAKPISDIMFHRTCVGEINLDFGRPSAKFEKN